MRYSLDFLMGNEKAYMAKVAFSYCICNPAQSLRTNKSGKVRCHMTINAEESGALDICNSGYRQNRGAALLQGNFRSADHSNIFHFHEHSLDNACMWCTEVVCTSFPQLVVIDIILHDRQCKSLE